MTIEDYRKHTDIKKRLIVQAKNIHNSCDYDYYSTKTAQCKDEMKRLQAEWKRIGPAGNQENMLWKQFRSIQDQFWKRIKLINKEMQLISLSDYVDRLDSDFEDAKFLNQWGRMNRLGDTLDEKRGELMALQDEVSQLEKELGLSS